MLKQSFFIFFLVAGCLTPLLYANEVKVSALLNKRQVQVNEEMPLTVRITGAKGNVKAPRIMNMDGIESYYTGRSSNVTFINGVSTSSVEFSYVLLPKQAGNFTLQPMEVGVGGQVYRTQAIPFTVLARATSTRQTNPNRVSTPPASGGANAPVQEPSPHVIANDENIFVEAVVDQATVYPNQQVLLTYSLYTRYDTRYEGFAEEPELSGFWIEEFPQDKEVRRETVRLKGKPYVRADIRKIALFPTESAEYTIQPGSIKVSVRQEPQAQSIFDEFFSDSFFSGSGFFSRRENRLLKPAPIKLNVVPFPEGGKPSNFRGAVGNFQMTASIDKSTVKQNEPVTVTIMIEGQGNIETLKQPTLPEIEDFKIYEADSSSELFKSGYVMGGKKRFEVVFIPKKAGAQSIPKLSFSYFNPQIRKYRTLFTPAFSINVEESEDVYEIPDSLSREEIFKKEIEVEGQDIHFIREELPETDTRVVTRWIYLGLLGADALLTLLFLFGVMNRRQEKIFAKDTALKRRKQAKSLVDSKVKGLKKFLKASKSEEVRVYFEEVDRVLTQYLSDKFNMSAHGTTRSDLRQKLAETLGSDDEICKSVSELYQHCDESRFGGGVDLPDDLRQNVFKVLKDTISKVEKAVK